MDRTPLFNQASGRRWEAAADGRSIIYAEEGLVLRIDRVEVRRIVVREIEVDGDPVEL